MQILSAYVSICNHLSALGYAVFPLQPKNRPPIRTLHTYTFEEKMQVCLDPRTTRKKPVAD